MEKTLSAPGSHHLNPHVTRDDDTSLIVGSLLMIGVTLLLFFIPAVNGFIGGLVGGYKVGSVKRGILAALLPAVVAGIGLWIITALLSAPIVGMFAGAAVTVIIALSEVGLFIGAVVGGALARR